MDVNQTLIKAAGGNGTAIEIVDKPLERSEYETRGKALGDQMEAAGAEQTGFLVLSSKHFEMAGGEFCGNASRAAALLFAQATGTSHVTFTVSGFDGTVSGDVDLSDPDAPYVSCSFPGMPTIVHEAVLPGGLPVSVVDLGGIVHAVIEAPFPADEADYRAAHQEAMDQLGLARWDAAGVIWYERSGESVIIHPVVWVKAINTFFYEESCGSGSIAVGRVTGCKRITQPTGMTIAVEINQDSVVLASELEVVRP